jgi:hypothetical protein
MKIPFANTEALLRRILACNARATVDEIRGAHPAFRTMSCDHLSLRMARFLDRGQAMGTK